MKEIIEIYMSRGRNAEHFQLHAAILAAVTEALATQYRISSVREKYATVFKMEDLIYLQNQAYANTKEMDAADKECDTHFLTFKSAVATYKNWPVEGKRIASEKLTFALEPFKNANGKPWAENRAMITNCLQVLRSDTYKAYVTELGLDEILVLLEAANNKCNDLMSDHLEEKRSREAADNLKVVRPQVDAAFELLRKAINAVYLMNELVDQNADTEAEVGAVIDAVNKFLLGYSATLSRRKAGTKANVKPGEDLPVDPKPEEERPDEL